MTMASALFSHLSGKASVIAQVAQRIYPGIAPETAVYPFITFTIVSEDHQRHFGGASGLVRVLMQIDVWTSTIAEREVISEVVRNALDGYTGLMGTENLPIRSCFLTDRVDLNEASADGKQKPIMRKSHNFDIWHTESLPTL